METLGRILRFVVWVVILSWVFRMIGRIAGGALRRAMGANAATGDSSAAETETASSRPRMAARQLVRDPVCGMHLAETLAIPYRDGGELVHFCSAECREKYAAGGLRRAANG